MRALVVVGLVVCACQPTRSQPRAQAMILPDALPPSRGNAYADSEAAAQLGFKIFFDARFSSDGDMRCATCHLPEASFGDAKATSTSRDGSKLRNSPSVFNAARNQWQFWDGRADSLWSQPAFAFENPVEMHFSRIAIAQRIGKTYAKDYAAVFGALPDLTRFALAGKPGDAAYDSLSADDKIAIDTVLVNVGKSLDAYMRRIATGRAPIDRYLLGDDGAISSVALKGLDVFLTRGCASCHSGPTLSDEAFHEVIADDTDPGRAAAYAVLDASPFRIGGAFADPSDLAPLEASPGPDDLHAFKTPSLRNVASTAPYFHDGRASTLDAAVSAHGARLSTDERDAVIAFLKTLDGDYPPSPWNSWPEK